MTDQNEPIELPPPKADRGNQATDDHVAAAPTPRGEAQPSDELGPNVADEHLRSPSQGVRPEKTPADQG
jgi:hypothetical protein